MRRPAVDRPRLQAVQRRRHARRIAVKAVVDHGDAAGGLLDPAPGHDADMAELVRQRRCVETGGIDRRQRRQRILHAMRRAGRQAELDLLATDLGADIPALAARGMVQFAHLRRLAEADDLAVPFRRLDVGRQHQHAVLRQAARDADLLAADRFEAAELFQMHRLHVHHQRHGRLRQFAQPRDFAGLVHAHFHHPQRSRSDRHCTASAARPRNC